MQNKVKLGFFILLLLLGMSADGAAVGLPQPPALVANPKPTDE